MRRESVTGVAIPSTEEGIGSAMAEALCPIRVLARVCNRINAAAPGRGNGGEERKENRWIGKEAVGNDSGSSAGKRR